MLGGAAKVHEYSSLASPRLRNLSGSFHQRQFTHCFVSDTLMGTLGWTGCELTLSEHRDSGCVSSICSQAKEEISVMFKL